MTKTRDQIVKELDEKIPRDVISQRDGGGGRSLSYLEGHYVIDRLNKVLGQGNWCYESEVTLIRADDLEKEKYGKKVKYHSAHYMAKVTLNFKLDDDPKPGTSSWNGTSSFTDYGYGDGSDPQTPGKAHELAIKESVTDGLKRCAKNLGMSMGLALYDKTQENVEDEPKQANMSQPAAPVPAAVVRPTPEAISVVKSNNAPSAAKTSSRDVVQKSIQEHIKVIVDKKLSTTEAMRDQVKNFGADKSADLNDEQAQAFLTHLKGMLK